MALSAVCASSFGDTCRFATSSASPSPSYLAYSARFMLVTPQMRSEISRRLTCRVTNVQDHDLIALHRIVDAIGIADGLQDTYSRLAGWDTHTGSLEKHCRAYREVVSHTISS